MAPSRSQSTGLARPAAGALGRVDLDALAAQVGRGPAVHHPLVADQAAYGPVRAGRHGYVEPGGVGVARERRHRVAQRGEVLVDASGWWARREAQSSPAQFIDLGVRRPAVVDPPPPTPFAASVSRAPRSRPARPHSVGARGMESGA